jgi:hypothetical protein
MPQRQNPETWIGHCWRSMDLPAAAVSQLAAAAAAAEVAKAATVVEC